MPPDLTDNAIGTRPRMWQARTGKETGAHASDMTAPATYATTAQPPARQYQHWRETVSATHLAWDLPARSEAAFDGRIRSRALGPAGLIACRCDPCDGRRGRGEIARDDAAYFGLLCILEGGEWLDSAGRETPLAAGHAMLWDSTRRMRFRAPARLRKITLLLPQDLLLAALPDAADRVGEPVSLRDGAGALLLAQLRLLLRGDDLPAMQQPAVLHSALTLLGAAFDPLAGHGSDGRDNAAALRRRIMAHIRGRLDDPALDPQGIADALGLSLRHLHRVFAAGGCTLDRWIWHQRLLRCRHDLSLAPAQTGSIAQIAFRWGFSDAAHFSRAFRRAFGVSPREWRRR